MKPPARLIDAASNRAREALRVLEDCARFGLDSPPLCERLKAMRHGLRAALDQLPLDRAMLLASRDVEGDVGRTIAGAGEYTRKGMGDIAAAAGARLTESLRSLEEAAKGLGAPDAAETIEALRYQAYDVERAIGLALAGGRAPQWRLCVLITESLCRHHPWDTVAAMAIDGGADCLQLREKELSGGALVDRAQRLIAMARPRGVHVIVNDRVDVALLAGADGVHVGQQDLSVAQVRTLAGERLLVGVSTESIEQAQRATDAGADYCGVGPMFPTTTKDKPRIAGVEYLREYLAHEAFPPHLAIGGIDDARAEQLAQAGCRGIAVSSFVCGAKDPREACARLVKKETTRQA